MNDSPDKKQKTQRKFGKDRPPVKVLKKVATSDGKVKIVRPGAPEFENSAKKDAPASTDQRIAKHLARVGVASRREVERMIADGRVKLNGKLLDTPATLVGPRDRIEVDDVLVGAKERTRLWLFHKPSGLVTTNNDPEGRKTVFESLPDDMPRVLSVGRLDINTEGLLLLTNDGGLARQLELPSTGWLRRYRVRAHGEVTDQQLAELQNGIAVDGVLYGPIEATLDRTQGKNNWITLGLREGKNREVRKVLGALGLEVNRLIRISYGPFQLGEMETREIREIRGRTLQDQLGAKLIAESGADFEAAIINHVQGGEDRKPKREPFKSKSTGSRTGTRSGGDKTKRGQISKDSSKRDSFDRLDTRKRSEGPSGKKTDGKEFGKPRGGKGGRGGTGGKGGAGGRGGSGADRRR